MSSRSAILAVLVLGAVLSVAPRALACGASSGGVAGVSACSLSEHEEETRLRWRVGASYSFTSTRIRFDANTVPDETRDGVVASVAYRPSLRWTLELGIGPLFAGHLRIHDVDYDFKPGILTSFGASWRVLDALDARPFVLLTAQAAFVAAATKAPTPASESAGYQALDIRLGVAAGWTLWNVLSPYAVVRAFGGPVYWTYLNESVVGTDTHHYQVDVFVEGIPLGEQAVTAGAGVSF
jgi:hypothetical protein